MLPKGLLKAGVKFIATAGTERGRDWRLKQPSSGFRTGLLHPMLERTRFSLKGVSRDARVGDTKNRVASLDVVGNSETRLRLLRCGKTVIKVASNAEVKRPVSFRNRVLNVERELLHIRVPVKWKRVLPVVRS